MERDFDCVYYKFLFWKFQIGKNEMDCPYQDIHKVWQEKFEKGQIRSIDLRNFWKYYVPNIFSPEVSFIMS